MFVRFNSEGLLHNKWFHKQPNLNSISTISLPNSMSTSMDSFLSDVPPCYNDPSHPWFFHENLPDYNCSIDFVTYMRVKCEYLRPDLVCKSRSWREYYIHIYGTKVSAYRHNPRGTKKGLEPVWSFSMQDATISLPKDYVKYRFVVRLNIANGPQFLFSAYTLKEKLQLMDVAESSICISTDLDVRVMPELNYYRRREQRPNPATSTQKSYT